MYYFLYPLNALLMIVMPIVLARFIKSRRQASWELFAIGAVTFIMSQVGHLPFNLLVTGATADLMVGLQVNTRLLLTATFLGLSAGLFEEGARYLTFRYWATNARSWGRSLMVGAGHGGSEAIILGILAGVNTAFYFAFRAGRLTLLESLEDQMRLASFIDQLFSAPWYDALLGAVERFFVLFIHLALSLLVMRSVWRGQKRWLALAFLWHSVVNAVALLALQWWGKYVAEAVIGTMAVVSLAAVISMREPEPRAAEPQPLPALRPRGPIRPPTTDEQLEDSKYL